jgi:hypothetical protein
MRVLDLELLHRADKKKERKKPFVVDKFTRWRKDQYRLVTRVICHQWNH